MDVVIFKLFIDKCIVLIFFFFGVNDVVVVFIFVFWENYWNCFIWFFIVWDYFVKVNKYLISLMNYVKCIVILIC